MYNVLKQKYGYLTSHIYVLVADGTDPANDRRHYNGTYDSSPLDFDGDGVNDIAYPATKSAITEVFDQLSSIMTPDDYLFIFSTDHGNETVGDVVLVLWGEQITATQFAAEVNKVNASHISVVMEQCFSGGFIPKICNNNRTIMTACTADELSYAMAPDYTYNEFVYHWISAVGEQTPQGTYVNADSNVDGYISMFEAFSYAEAHDNADETPQYCTQGHVTGANIDLLGRFYDCEGPELDRYIKDCPTDFGQEPSGCVDFWDSPDIWVRNNQDGQTENQNPVYRPNGSPNYIYVKVRNLSCVPSPGSEKLKIYWAKANTSYAWPDYWNGTAVNDQGIPLSSELPSVDIPVIQPGQEVVVAVPWVVPNPENYSDMEEPWHYCIMARVESENDPMTFPETADSGENIRNNNNIAQKNVSIVNPSPGNPIGATVGVGNAFPVSRDFVFEFQDKTETGKFLYREAEITIRLDDRLLQTWKNSGGALNNMKQVSDNTFLITDNNASFGSLKFEPHQIDLLTLNFNFLTSEITDK